MRATDTVMPTAEEAVSRNPMRPPPDTPRTAGRALALFWRHPSPLILLAMLLAIAALRAVQGPLAWRDLFIGVVVCALFPLNEWLIHVHVLHYRPRQVRGREVDFYLPKTHRRHHADPWNLEWVFVPRHVHALVGASLLVAYAVAGPWRAELLSLAFVYLLLGLHYEWVHYLTHIAWCPPLRYYERRVREHRYHHFRNERHWWGVSMGLADRLLRTAPDARETPRSETNRDLGIKG